MVISYSFPFFHPYVFFFFFTTHVYPYISILSFFISTFHLILEPPSLLLLFFISLHSHTAGREIGLCLSFSYLFFPMHFPTDSLFHFLSYLNIIFFIHSLFFFYHYLFFLYSFSTIIFFNKKCYIHNIFRNTFTRIISKSYVESCY